MDSPKWQPMASGSVVVQLKRLFVSIEMAALGLMSLFVYPANKTKAYAEASAVAILKYSPVYTPMHAVGIKNVEDAGSRCQR